MSTPAPTPRQQVVNPYAAAPAPTGTGMNVTSAKPKFGDYYPGSNTVVWIGGPPLADFSGTALTVFPSPLSIRGLSPEHEIKGYTKRVLDGCATKFKRDDPAFSLMDFADEALNHMQTNGMDTVFYMKGADANSAGEELFTYHSKHTKSSVAAFIQAKMNDGTYDSYALAALKESAQWLVNSLDETLKSSLCPQLATKPTGPEVWMLIVAEVQADSLRRCVVLVKQFKALTLAQFRGENVRDYAKTAEFLLIQLERDDQLPSTHLLDIVDHFTACTVMDFKIHWMHQRTAIEEFVMETLGKDRVAISQMPNKIHFRDLLEEGKSRYTNLQHVWGTPAQSKEQALVGQVKALQAKLDWMDQQLKQKPTRSIGGNDDDSKKPKGKCWHCGGDHFKKDCPELKNKTPKQANPPPPAKDSAPGKWAPPKDGEPHEKMIGDVKRFWCKKCRNGRGCWTTTHLTSGHKSKEELAADKASGQPSASLASAPVCQELHSSWFGADK